MTTFTNRADLLIAAGESIKMQEKQSPCTKPMCKYDNTIVPISKCESLQDYGCYEFPLAVVEGKPVFVGDELYHEKYGLLKILSFDHLGLHGKQTDNSYPNCGAIGNYSWLPPKPRTVMVELMREDAEAMAAWNPSSIGALNNTTKACRKALEDK